jgi:hypothetical protein
VAASPCFAGSVSLCTSIAKSSILETAGPLFKTAHKHTQPPHTHAHTRTHARTNTHTHTTHTHTHTH